MGLSTRVSIRRKASSLGARHGVVAGQPLAGRRSGRGSPSAPGCPAGAPVTVNSTLSWTFSRLPSSCSVKVRKRRSGESSPARSGSAPARPRSGCRRRDRRRRTVTGRGQRTATADDQQRPSRRATHAAVARCPGRAARRGRPAGPRTTTQPIADDGEGDGVPVEQRSPVPPGRRRSSTHHEHEHEQRQQRRRRRCGCAAPARRPRPPRGSPSRKGTSAGGPARSTQGSVVSSSPQPVHVPCITSARVCGVGDAAAEAAGARSATGPPSTQRHEGHRRDQRRRPGAATSAATSRTRRRGRPPPTTRKPQPCEGRGKPDAGEPHQDADGHQVEQHRPRGAPRHAEHPRARRPAARAAARRARAACSSRAPGRRGRPRWAEPVGRTQQQLDVGGRPARIAPGQALGRRAPGHQHQPAGLRGQPHRLAGPPGPGRSRRARSGSRRRGRRRARGR